MADTAQIQQMLANLQNQLATVSSLTGQLATPTPPITAWTPPMGTNPLDIEAIVKATLASELKKLGPPQQTPVQQVPTQLISQSTPQPTSSTQPAAPHQSLFPPLAPQTQPQSTQPPAPPQLAAPTQPQGTPDMQMPPQNMQELMMRDFLNQLKVAIGSALSVEQQQWVSGNLFGLPDYFRSPDGKEALTAVLNKYYQYVAAQPK